MPTITDHAIATPDKPAFIMGSTGETVTFGELDAIANQVAQLLRASGVQQGQHIAIFQKAAIETPNALPRRRATAVELRCRHYTTR